MNEIHLSVKGTYGYRRMTLNLKRLFGRNVNVKRVRHLMHVTGIHCVIRQRPLFVRNRPQPTTENILNRDFNSAGPNQKMGDGRHGIEVWCFSEGVFEWHSRPI
ncbi:IS3 family transposase [Exiguobacterium undae]|uniref:IS3 family transposase n=1 Tax=Exiguobacterium TaxID=33986 RepID=UPI002E123153